MPIEMDDTECDGHAEGTLTARGGVGGRDQWGRWQHEIKGSRRPARRRWLGSGKAASSAFLGHPRVGGFT